MSDTLQHWMLYLVAAKAIPRGSAVSEDPLSLAVLAHSPHIICQGLDDVDPDAIPDGPILLDATASNASPNALTERLKQTIGRMPDLIIDPRGTLDDRGFRPLSPGTEGLLLNTGSDPEGQRPVLAQYAAALGNGKVDAFDAFAELVSATALDYLGDGGALLELALGLCCDDDGLRLHREVPVRVRLPTFGASSVAAEVALSHLEPCLFPAVEAVPPAILTACARSETPGGLGLRIELDAGNAGMAEISLSGHRMRVERVRVRLDGAQVRRAPKAYDPLDAYGDPLMRYARPA